MIQQFITKKRLILTSIIVFMCFLIYVWFNFSLYVFNIQSQRAQESTTLSVINQVNSPELFTIFGISVVPRSADAVEVKTSSSTTRKILENQPWFGVKQEDIKLNLQKEVSKVGKDGVGCDIKVDSAYYSYSCDGQSNTFVSYATPSRGIYENTVAPSDEYSVITRSPYKNGLLSLVQENHSPNIRVVYSKTSINSPLEEQELELGLQSDRVELFVGTRSDGFVILDSANNKAYIFSNLNKQYQTITASKRNDKNERLIGCDLRDKNVVCFAQNVGNTANESVHGPQANEGTFIFTSLNSRKVTRQNTDTSFDTICINQDYIISQSNDLLYSTNIKTPQKSYLLDSGTSNLTCGNQLAYTKLHSIYAVKKATASLLFKENKLSLSSTSVDSSNLYFTAFIDNDGPQNIHTYKLTDKTVLKSRFESVFMSIINDLPVFDIDYDDASIYVKPQVSVISDRQTGEVIIDQDSLNNTKREVERLLANKGLLEDRTLVFYE